MPTGTIIKGIGGFYYVKVEEKVFECKARGIFRKDDITPLPGDSVSIFIVDAHRGTGNIVEISERRTQLVRPSVANVDQVAVIIAVKSPAPDFVLLDKLLITAEIKDIHPIVCINKIDLDETGSHEEIAKAYDKAGYDVLLLNSKRHVGFEALKERLKGKITVFAGQSGVGKSTILNSLSQDSRMETGEVSTKIERGRHTTRHAELFELESGGYVVDTPGFSSFELTDLPYQQLELYYPEFSDYLNKCRFTGCSHITEPECRIKEALAEGFIDMGRYNRYIQFYNSLKQEKGYTKKKTNR